MEVNKNKTLKGNKLNFKLPGIEATFFFKRKDGSVFACGEQDANAQMKNHEYVGRTSGAEYFKKMLELSAKAEKMKLGDIQAAMRKAFDEDVEAAKLDQRPPRDMSHLTFSSTNINGQ